jgi:hypothetical protein
MLVVDRYVSCEISLCLASPFSQEKSEVKSQVLAECKTDAGWNNFMVTVFNPFMQACAAGDRRAKQLLECKPLNSTVAAEERAGFLMQA